MSLLFIVSYHDVSSAVLRGLSLHSGRYSVLLVRSVDVLAARVIAASLAGTIVTQLFR